MPYKDPNANKERYHWYKEHGICTTCGANWVKPGMTRCEPCFKRMYSQRNARDPDHEKIKAGSREKRERYIAEGRCIWCGMVKPEGETRQMCPTCRMKMNQSTQIWRMKKRLERQLEGGTV